MLTGWTRSALGSLVRPSKRKAEPSEIQGRPYLGLEHIESGTNRIIAQGDASEVKSTTAVFSEGDVLYSKLRPYLNKVAIAPFDGVGSTEILVFEKLPHLESKYLMWLLSRQETVRIANERASGVQLPRITFDKIADIEVPIPPLVEQRRIVERVEVLLEEVSKARDRLAQVPLIVKKFRQSILAAAFSGMLTKEWRYNHPDAAGPTLPPPSKARPRGRRGANLSGDDELLVDDELPDLPETWQYVRVDRLVESGTVITYGIVLPGPEIRRGVPYVRGQDVEDGWLRTDALRHTTKEIAAKYTRSSLLAGDVLLCIIRNLRVAIVPAGLDGANITQGMVRIRPSSAAVDREFLAQYLRSPLAQGWMKRRYFGMDMPRINVEDARAIPVALPPLEEQGEIVTQVLRLLAVADSVEQRVRVAGACTNRLQDAILERAFAGELVPQDSKDEPADLLLERIRTQQEEAMNTRKRVPKEPTVTRKSEARTLRVDLAEMVGKSKRGVTPEDLFARAGYRADDPDDVARFYQALRQAIQKGVLRELRTSDGDPRIVAAP